MYKGAVVDQSMGGEREEQTASGRIEFQPMPPLVLTRDGLAIGELGALVRLCFWL